MIINKIDWMKRLKAYPVVNQKYSLSILEISNIAHTSILKEPKDFFYLIKRSCEIYPNNGPTVMPISSKSIR